jgi:hypothetical protein
MGSRSHPCCEKNINEPAPAAAVQQSHVLHPVFAAVMLDVSSVLPIAESEFRNPEFAPPPHSPPSLNSPLRI